MGVRGDLRMVEMAIKKRWPTEELMPLAIDAVRRGLMSGDTRAEATAVRAVLAMEAMNQKDEQHADEQLDQGRNRVLDLLARARTGSSDRLAEPGGSGITGGLDGQSPPRITDTENQGRES